MKSKKLIAIIAVILAVCLLVYIAVRDTDHIAVRDTDHDEHEGHDEHNDAEQAIEFTLEEIQEIGLKTAVAGSGTIDTYISLAGEIGVNQDWMAHVVPRVEGVVAEVRKKLGIQLRRVRL